MSSPVTKRYNVSAVRDALIQELVRQDFKWGSQLHNPADWYLITAEEFGEIASDLNKAFVQPDANPNEERLTKAKTEIIQTIACLCRLLWSLEDIEHEEGKVVPR